MNWYVRMSRLLFMLFEKKKMFIVSYWIEVRINQFIFGDIVEKMIIIELSVDKKRI